MNFSRSRPQKEHYRNNHKGQKSFPVLLFDVEEIGDTESKGRQKDGVDDQYEPPGVAVSVGVSEKEKQQRYGCQCQGDPGIAVADEKKSCNAGYHKKFVGSHKEFYVAELQKRAPVEAGIGALFRGKVRVVQGVAESQGIAELMEVD